MFLKSNILVKKKKNGYFEKIQGGFFSWKM